MVTCEGLWLWRKVLFSQYWCRGVIVTCVGDGRDNSVWLDYWLMYGPLCDMLFYKVLSSTWHIGMSRYQKLFIGVHGSFWRTISIINIFGTQTRFFHELRFLIILLRKVTILISLPLTMHGMRYNVEGISILFTIFFLVHRTCFTLLLHSLACPLRSFVHNRFVFRFMEFLIISSVLYVV